MSRVIEGVGTTLAVGSAGFCYVSLGSLGVNVGDALDATCLSNSGWITKLPPALKDVSDITFTARFAPEDWDAIVAETGVNQELVISFPSIGTLTFNGYLQSFEPEEGAVGDTWNGTGVIVCTNMTSGFVEVGPVWAGA